MPSVRSGLSRLTPERLRDALARRGPIGIKLAQFLVLRPDIVADAYLEALLPLLDRAPAVGWPAVRSVVDADLVGREPGLVWLDPDPLATGSIAQVHEGLLQDGRRVAVKVKRPDAERLVRRDLPRLRRIAGVLALARSPLPVPPRDLVDEFATWLDEELDFAHELANAVRLGRAAEGIERLVVAPPVPELCSERVVTTELLVGTALSDVLRMVRQGRRAELVDQGFDLDALARTILTTTLEQVFVAGVFHADPHPGNLIALDDGSLGLVDHGLVRTISAESRQALLDYLTAVAQWDISRMHRGLVDFLQPGPQADLDTFKEEFTALMNAWSEQRGGSRTGGRSATARLLSETMAAARRCDLRPPTNILVIYRTLLAVEVLANELSDTVGLDTVSAGVYARIRARELVTGLRSEQLFARLAEADDFVRNVPGALGRLIQDLDEERFSLAVTTRESADDRRRSANHARLIAASVLVVATAVLLAAPPGALGPSPAVFVVLLAVLGVLLAVVAYLWWRLS